MLDRAARAIWEEQRKQEISALAALSVDTAYLQKAGELMVGSDARTQTMIGFSAISKSLGIGLHTHLNHSTERDRKEMLEGLGPLATDAAKLRLARLMGWVAPLVSDGVQALRQARNLVAHDIVELTAIPFPNNLSKEARAYLDAIIKRMVDAANGLENVEPKLAANDEHRVGRYALVIAYETLSCIMWGPAKLRLGMRPDMAVPFDFDSGPDWARESNRNLARGLILLSGGTAEML